MVTASFAVTGLIKAQQDFKESLSGFSLELR